MSSAARGMAGEDFLGESRCGFSGPSVGHVLGLESKMPSFPPFLPFSSSDALSLNALYVYAQSSHIYTLLLQIHSISSPSWGKADLQVFRILSCVDPRDLGLG
jgi:hypothetical protein